MLRSSTAVPGGEEEDEVEDGWIYLDGMARKWINPFTDIDICKGVYPERPWKKW
jgi:hypothetical protein